MRAPPPVGASSDEDAPSAPPVGTDPSCELPSRPACSSPSFSTPSTAARALERGPTSTSARQRSSVDASFDFYASISDIPELAGDPDLDPTSTAPAPRCPPCASPDLHSSSSPAQDPLPSTQPGVLPGSVVDGYGSLERPASPGGHRGASGAVEADALRLAAEGIALRQQNEHLLVARRNVLQAELKTALDQYHPGTVIQADTVADRILQMVLDCMRGTLPAVVDLVAVRDAVLDKRDIYVPADVGRQLQDAALDDDVSRALLTSLGQFRRTHSTGEHASGSLAAAAAAAAAAVAAASSNLSSAPSSGEHAGGGSNGAPWRRPLSGTQVRLAANSSNVSAAMLSIDESIWGADVEGSSGAAAVAGAVGSVGGGGVSAGSVGGPAGSERVSNGGGAFFSGLRDAIAAMVADDGGDSGGATEDAADTQLCDANCDDNCAAHGNPSRNAILAPTITSHGLPLKVPIASPLSAAALSMPPSVPLIVPAVVPPIVPPGAPCSTLAAAAAVVRFSTHSLSRTRSATMMMGVVVEASPSGRTGPEGAESAEAEAAAMGLGPSGSTTFANMLFGAVAPMAPPEDEIEAMLSKVGHWQFDTYLLTRVTRGRPLSTLAYFLFVKSGLINTFDLNGVVLARFLRRVEKGYPDNPYHNATHAADVLHTFHALLHGGGLVPGYADPLTLMACYLAAIVHDFEHVGKTNEYLVTSGDTLALRYNDKSPLENHHVAAAFAVLRSPECNFLLHLPKHEQVSLRRTIIDLVLGTDMKQHFTLTSQFTSMHRLPAHPLSAFSAPRSTYRRSNDGVDGLQISPSAPACSMIAHTWGGWNHAVGSGDKGAAAAIVPKDEAERMLSLQVALKCADLGHLAATLNVHLKWVRSLEEEFFRQGDQEKASGMPVSPLFDRNKPGVTKSQVGFLEVVVIPLFTGFSQVFSGAQPMLTFLMRNYAYWQQRMSA